MSTDPIGRRWGGRRVRFAGLRAAARTAVCVLKVYPMLPSRPLNRLTPRPVIETLRYPSSHGPAEGQLYRPARPGPHPGVVVCLGVVPFGVDHPQVPRLGEALARSGFAALLYWSPAMRDFRLTPEDVADIASAYDALLARRDIDPARSGLLGTCVGGAFALMAAAEPAISHRTAFAFAYAPYSSMWTLARDIASATRCPDGMPQPWPVDPLTRKVFVHSVTALLAPAEAEQLRAAFAEPSTSAPNVPPTDGAEAERLRAAVAEPAGVAARSSTGVVASEAPRSALAPSDPASVGGPAIRAAHGQQHAAPATPAGYREDARLSEQGRTLLPLLTTLTPAAATEALASLSPALRDRLDAMSPLRSVAGIGAPLIVLLHDRDDMVIPVSESRQLHAALSGRAGAHYTEFTVFRHLDPTKGKPAPLPLARELVKLARALYPLFRATT